MMRRALGVWGLAGKPVSTQAAMSLLNRLLSGASASKRPPPTTEAASLRKLTMAALALPGLSMQAAHAATGDIASFQYGHYKQTAWQLLDGLKSQYNPLQVDNIEANGLLTFEDRWKFNFNFVQDTWSGATPVTSAPNALGGNNPNLAGASPLIKGNGSIRYDKQMNPYRLDSETGEYVEDTRLVQTVASASPEIRNQGDFRLGYEWDEAALGLAGGISQEPDFNSAFGSINGRMDFNQKRTAVNLGLSYNNSDINALINPTYAPYVNKSYYQSKGQIRLEENPNGAPSEYLTGNRQDWSSHLSVAQVVNKELLVESGLGFIRSTGYLANPYKAVDMVFVDYNQDPWDQNGTELYAGNVQGVIERRPEERNQGIWDLRMVQYVEGFDASLNAGYRLFQDDWGITAHTFDINWVQPIGSWSVTPRFRYYSQDGADFYRPYFLFDGPAPTQPGPFGLQVFDLAGMPLSAYSSDYRLSAYGAIGTGLTVATQIGKAMAFEAGFEWYTHAGDLRMGGAGQGSWADFDYYQFNAAVKVDLSAMSMADVGGDEHAHHHHHGHEDHRQAHIGMDAPAGVLFNHMLPNAGDLMLGVRYAYTLQEGNMYHGSGPVTDQQIVNQGCQPWGKCTYTPLDMTMNMYMIDLMYAPTDWMTLMLMPQFMSMDMHLRRLDGAPPPSPDDIHASHGSNPYHGEGGIGDTYFSGMFKLFEAPGHKLHITLGFTAPTGSVDRKTNGNSEFEHYGMQLGSGTWSFWPSMTYNGFEGDFKWGAQASTIAQLEGANDSGYAVGNLFQASSWGGYQIQDWLSGTVRALYTYQDSINGQYPEWFKVTGPMDAPQSYGGQYLDIGIGLNAMVTSGDFAGNHVGIEWLQPAYNDYNGYQLDRTGTLWASWGLSF